MDLSDAEVLDLLRRALDGDTNAIAELAAVGNVRLFEAWHGGARPALIVPRDGVISLLRGMLDRTVSPGHARDWAFFVRHGHLGSWSRTPIAGDATGVIERAEATVFGEELPIDWEPSFEDQINETTFRLDEIGDSVDGIVTDEEIRDFLRKLSG